MTLLWEKISIIDQWMKSGWTSHELSCCLKWRRLQTICLYCFIPWNLWSSSLCSLGVAWTVPWSFKDIVVSSQGMFVKMRKKVCCMAVRQLVSSAWAIWKERNSCTFEGEEISELNLTFCNSISPFIWLLDS